MSEGISDADTLGEKVGTSVAGPGLLDGKSLGTLVSVLLGLLLGAALNATDGAALGLSLAMAEGAGENTSHVLHETWHTS